MKNYKYLILALFLTYSVSSFCQNWEWVRHLNSTGDVYLRGLDLDDADNIYVAAEFKAATDIGAPGDVIPVANRDVFVAKYDNNNNYVWHEQFFSSGNERSQGIVVDQNNDVIILGFYNDDITIGLSLLQEYVAGEDDMYLAKYESDGSYLWAKTIAYGPGDVRSNCISVDEIGNIYVSGRSNDTIYFTNDTLITNSGRIQNFLAKYDSDGNFIWAAHIRNTGTNYGRNMFTETEVTNSDEIYLGGFFDDSVYVEDVSLKSNGSSGEDILLIKYNGLGEKQWVRKAGSPDIADRCNSISTDKYGNVFITGFIGGTALFDSTGAGLMNSSPITTTGSTDFLVAKYNKNGSLIWKKNKGNTGADIGYGAYIFENVIQFTGYYSGEVIFNQDTLQTTGISDNNTGFFAYDTKGNPIAAKAVYGSGDDRGENIVYDDKGNTYIGGFFRSDTLLVGSNMLLRSSTGTDRNSFFTKYQHKFSVATSKTENITCSGGNDGEIIVTSYFGVPPYNYAWSGNVSNYNDSLAYDLSADTYSVTITDARDSSATAIITLTEPDPIVITLDSTNVSCYNGQDGAIDITVTGGTVAGDYIYAWTGAGGLKPTEGDQTNLFAGKFKVIVTDDEGCSEQDSTNVTQPDPIHFAGTAVTPAVPSGTNTGSIDLEVQGGTPAYAYAWDMGGVPMPGRTNDTLNNLYGANYTATVTDDNGCVADTTMNVPDQDNLGILIYTTDVSCYGLSDGSAYVSVVSGDKGQSYTYYWEDAFGTPYGTDTNITNVPAGRYYVTVTEVGGDARVAMANDTVITPDSISLSITPTHVKCFGASTGAVTMVTTGGTPIYDYAWSSGHTTESFANAPAGKYSVLVTDANGCTAEDSTEITQPDTIEISFNILNPVICFGSLTGQIQAIVSGGSGTFDYLWDDPGTQTTSVATGLEGGFYTLQVTDVTNNCIIYDDITLNEPAELIVSDIDTHHVECFQTTSGSIAITMSGGTAPYHFSWSPIQPDSNVIENIGAGIYTVAISDANDCPANISPVIDIEGPASALDIDLAPGSKQENPCFGNALGEFEVTATGGWGNYEFSIDGNIWQSSGLFTDLTADFYLARVRDENGCIVNIASAINITEPDELIILSEFVIGNSIIITASGGTSPYAFSLNGEDPQSSGQFNGLPDGEYSVNINDENSCGPVSSNGLIVGTGIEEDMFNKGLKIYPNPTNGPIYIEFNVPDESTFDIEIYNISGKKVISEKANLPDDNSRKISVDLSEKGAGMYFLKINGIEIDTKILVK